MIALTVLSVACAKNEEDKPNGNDVPQEEQTGKPGEDGKIVFTAIAPTKTAIDSNDEVVTWEAGDEVKFVWAGGSTTATAASDGASTTFSVEVGDGITELYAVYPASVGGSYDSGNVNIHFNGSLSDGSFAANDICVAKAVKTGDTWSTTLAFKNAACLLKVGVTSSTITKVQVYAGNSENITGYLPVNIDGGGVVSYGAIASGESDHVTMAVSGPGSYYIPVLPGVTLSNGFQVKLFEGDDQLTPFYYNGSFTTERGKVIKLNDIESHAGQFYVTPSGAGTMSGQSWSNAMDIAKFKTFVTDQDNYTFLKGSTFHFSADEFSFGDDYLKLIYTDHIVNLTFEGTVTASDTTVFLGRTNTSDDNMAGVLWPQTNSYLTVKNVKFTGTNGKSNSSAIRINNGAKELTLDHCYFRDNQTSGNGGSISLMNSCHLTIKDCSFSGNRGAGAVLHVNNTSANVDILDTEIKGNFVNSIYGQNVGVFNLTRVLFKGNHADGESGAAGWFENSGTYTFTDCDFIGNHADYRGGAVAFYKIQGNIIGGKFQGNYTSGNGNNYSGGAIAVDGTGGGVNCTNVLFQDNYSFVGSNTNAGGIIRLTASGNIARFDNCVFDNNWSCRSSQSNNGCAAIINCRNGGTIYYFNACEFKNNSSGRGYSSGNEQGGNKGQVISTYASSTICMNNCSIHDNFCSRNSDDTPWLYFDNAENTFILSNSTVIGDRIRRPEDSDVLKAKTGVIRLQTDGTYAFINNIICSKYSDGKSIGCAATYNVPAYYCKVSPGLDSDTNWTNTTGFGEDYWADSSCFGGWAAPHTWNGTMTGTNSSMKAATADVNTEIQNADADFYAWLNSIGALGKDINGNSRGATSWPGCYQN